MKYTNMKKKKKKKKKKPKNKQGTQKIIYL